MVVTRTVGPLHFEDLEPKRFEDLVRQLAYDFKHWRRLEATGRSGTDDGFDARGFEIVNEEPAEEDIEEETCVTNGDRLWLIQCKRERTISPAKLSTYLDDIRLSDNERLYGVVFTAACDFSKRARDLFRKRCEALGIEEWHLWGKAELEDLLFQPRNDALLFAYFGLSLTIRHRTQKAEIRSKLAMKRKANRILKDKYHQPVLLRSPDAIQYPSCDDIPNFQSRPKWVVQNYIGMYYNGLLFSFRRHFAYLDDEGISWDAALIFNDDRALDDPWKNNFDNQQLRQDIFMEWRSLPTKNQAWFEIDGVIPFDQILDIDEIGDEYIRAPHVYVPFSGISGPFSGFTGIIKPVDNLNRSEFRVKDKDDQRITFFKEEWRHNPQ